MLFLPTLSSALHSRPSTKQKASVSLETKVWTLKQQNQEPSLLFAKDATTFVSNDTKQVDKQCW